MPSPIDRTATKVKSGAPRSMRKAWRRSEPMRASELSTGVLQQTRPEQRGCHVEPQDAAVFTPNGVRLWDRLSRGGRRFESPSPGTAPAGLPRRRRREPRDAVERFQQARPLCIRAEWRQPFDVEGTAVHPPRSSAGITVVRHAQPQTPTSTPTLNVIPPWIETRAFSLNELAPSLVFQAPSPAQRRRARRSAR